jgi:hypothetical protein
MKVIPIKPNPNDWKKPLYIATFKEISYDDELNEIRTYNEPVAYEYNYQPVSSYLDIQAFGKDSTEMYKMVIPIKDKDLFKEYDLAYLNGATPEGEINNGDNANYVLLPPKEGNAVVIIYCQKIKGK